MLGFLFTLIKSSKLSEYFLITLNPTTRILALFELLHSECNSSSDYSLLLVSVWFYRKDDAKLLSSLVIRSVFVL